MHAGTCFEGIFQGETQARMTCGNNMDLQSSYWAIVMTAVLESVMPWELM